MTKLTGTAQKMLDAYGGEDLWRNSTKIDALVSVNGWAFRLKRQRPFREVQVVSRIANPVVDFKPIDRSHNFGVFTANETRIVQGDGQIRVRRAEPRAQFFYGVAGLRRKLWWDRLDMVYFAGYAFWNYFTLPALLLREDIYWRELSPNVLAATFPDSLPTHCREQVFHLAPNTGLLRRHDYVADVIGRRAVAAHAIQEHGEWKGLPYPRRRVVTPRRKDGSAAKGPVLIDITVHEWRIG
ncbi:hypothetical protein KDL45_11775 [bacterium]|nr:hypothetical protein [bacterium]